MTTLDHPALGHPAVRTIAAEPRARGMADAATGGTAAAVAAGEDDPIP